MKERNNSLNFMDLRFGLLNLKSYVNVLSLSFSHMSKSLALVCKSKS